MIINCKDTAQVLKYRVRDKIQEGKLSPTIMIIRFGNDPASVSYGLGIQKDCDFSGIYCSIVEYPEDISEDEAIDLVRKIGDSSVDGIMIQTPLPSHLNLQKLWAFIPPYKDVEGATYRQYKSCTAEAIMEILDKENLIGKTCLIVSRSKLIGRPLVDMLLERSANVIACHSYTDTITLNNFAKTSDIIISATGYTTTIDERNIHSGTLIIDAGFRKEENIVRGDFKFYNSNSNYTSVPGGIGLITRSKLLEHVVEAHIKSKPQKN